MKVIEWFSTPGHRLDIVAGFVDGILNALTLAAAKLLEPSGGASPLLAMKIGIATACTTMFVFFVAHYADLRTELVRAERELNLLSHGQLATTRLGRQVLRESCSAALVASFCGFVGATVPLLLILLVPGPPILGLAITIVLLGILGVGLAQSFFGSPLAWALTLMGGGVLLTIIGVKLNIVG
jgi:predicted membrane protein (TIGR00267 family)